MSRKFRPVFSDLPTHPRFFPMSAPAKLVWFVAKLQLGFSGLGLCLQSTLAELTGYSVEEVRAAEVELAEQGWIERDGPMLWMPEALADDPAMTPNNPKHRTALRAHLDSLPAYDVLARFRARYAEWLPGTVPDSLSDTVPDSLSDTVPESLDDKTLDTENISSSSHALARDWLDQFAEPDRKRVRKFFGTMPADRRSGWEGSIGMWLEGFGLPTSPKIIPADIAAGMTEYLARVKPSDRTWAPNHVRAFIVGMARVRLGLNRPDRPAAPSKGHGTTILTLE